MSNSASVNQSNQSSKPGETNLVGCLNCAHHLPQCTVCLLLMKIHLQPSPIQPMIANLGGGGAGGGGGVSGGSSSHHHNNNSNQLLSMNRTHSFFFQSPNLLQPNYVGMKKMSVQYKSPNHALQDPNNNTTTNIVHHHRHSAVSKNLLEELMTTHSHHGSEDLSHIKSRFFKFNHQSENAFFLAYSKYGNWFSWCQSCKHGGHIKHLIDWFKYHQKCPFLHCRCNCVSIDYSY
jgi:hypothetical protein